MTNIFPAIQNVHAQLTGWCSWQKAQTLAAAVVALRPKVIVEIGVWGGKSLIPMAMAQHAVSVGKCFAIDPWKADESALGQLNPADKEWWADQGKHDYAHAEFIKWRRLTQLEESIEILRMSSDEAPAPPEIDLLHTDGNHGEQALRDIHKFAPNVVPGGLIILDDLQWTGGAVTEAMLGLSKFGFDILYIVDDPETKNQWAVCRRVNP